MILIRITLNMMVRFNGCKNKSTKLNIQGEIERAIEIITAEKVDAIGSGAGLMLSNALAQVANFKVSELKIPDAGIDYLCNYPQLKKTIRIIKAENC